MNHRSHESRPANPPHRRPLRRYPKNISGDILPIQSGRRCREREGFGTLRRGPSTPDTTIKLFSTFKLIGRLDMGIRVLL